MNYNLEHPAELDAAFSYLTKLAAKHHRVKITKVNPGRSRSQNSYLHLILSAFAAEFGYTLDEAKTVYKRHVNTDIYAYEKHGSRFLRSTADLDKAEMQKSIDRFLKYAADNGCQLPLVTDTNLLLHMENYIEQHNAYL